MEAEERQGAGGISVDPAQRRGRSGCDRPDDLVFPGPGWQQRHSPAAPAPRRPTHNLRRVYQAAVAAAGKDLLHLDLQAPRPMQARVVAVIADRWRWRWPSCPRCAPSRRARDGYLERRDGRRMRVTMSPAMLKRVRSEKSTMPAVLCSRVMRRTTQA